MPPVFGPGVAVGQPLEVLGRGQGASRSPSHSTSSEHSGPTSPSSITTCRPASPKASPESLASMSASASASESVTSTPLPAASPSVLTTQGPGRVRR